MFNLLLSYHKNQIISYFKSKRVARIITLVLFAGVFIAVGVGLFYFFRHGFVVISKDKFFKEALLLYILEIFLLIVGYLIFISAGIGAVFGFFRKDIDSWIAASPKYFILPFYNIAKIFIASFWPLLVIAIPALGALRVVFGIGVFSLLVGFIGLGVLVAIIVLFAVVVVVLLFLLADYLSRYISHFRQIALIMFILVFSFLSVLVIERISGQNAVVILQAENLQISAAGTEFVENNFWIFPTHPAAKLLSSLQSGRYISAVGSIFTLMVVFVALLSIFVMLANFYLGLWQKIQEGSFQASPRLAKRRLKAEAIVKKSKLLCRFSNPVWVFMAKEFVVKARNSRDTAWFAFLVFLWVLQMSLNVVVSRTIFVYKLPVDILGAGASALQFITAVYFMSAVIVRFVFPAFSAERRTFWLVASAPVDRRKVFYGKLAFYALVFTAFAALTAYISSIFLGGGGKLIYLASVSSLTLTAVGLGLGALFPNLNTDDPQLISTSLPGLGFTLGAFLYGGVGAVSIYTFYARGSFSEIILFSIASILLFVWAFIYGASAAKSIDYSKGQTVYS